jgi:phage recombination protein Bet
MNAVTAFDLTPRQVALVHTTVAKDCNPDEFNLFMEAAKSYRLDPFRRQIMPLVFGKNAKDQSKRRMSIVVSRDGLRVIAQRCGNYRPASEPAEITYDEALKGPTNPKGIVLARVYLWQQDNRGEWFKVVGEAHWDEFAPISEEWAEGADGKRRPTGKKTLDPNGNWPKMPVVMITKCADAQALRAGWPVQFGGLYAEEELDRAKISDRDASEIVDAEFEEQRMARIGISGDHITTTWGDGWKLEEVPLGKFFDRAAEFVRESEPATVTRWAEANQIGLQRFWAKSPNDALELKRLIEAKTTKVAA